MAPYDDGDRPSETTTADDRRLEASFPEAVDRRGRDRAPPRVPRLHPPDTAPFYEQIKSRLQLEFNKNQLVEKLRRLKKKYRNVMSKFSSGKEVVFKSPHDQTTFDISRKIWNQSGKIIGFEDNSAMEFEETNNVNGNAASVEIDSENVKVSRKRSRSRIGKIDEDRPVSVSDGPVMPNVNNLNENESRRVDRGDGEELCIALDQRDDEWYNGDDDGCGRRIPRRRWWWCSCYGCVKPNADAVGESSRVWWR
ncbi:hypothetical protein Rs2_14656 [Raphanus sativus]|nr:hypothetical protein Rs2_14656 [Raphanus sativus]